jgi:hypothetical protein
MSTFDSAPFVSEGDAQTPALFDEVRDGLGTAEMSLEEMVLEMRRIRESSDDAGEVIRLT